MKVRALKHFCEGPPQYGLNTPASEYVDDGLRFLRTTDINDDGSVADDSAVHVSPSLVSPEHELRTGDLLLSRSGSLGRCLRFTPDIGPATFAGYLVRFRPKPDVEPRYLEYCTRAAAFQQTIEAEAISSTISNFNAERYANLLVPWWPREQQRAIADYLDIETARIDALIAKKRRMIELLDERRAERIDNLVWGTGDEAAWQRPAFNAIIDIAEGQVDPTTPPYADLVLIAPNHVESGSGRLLARETAEGQGAISGKYLCAKGDVIYSKIRPALQKAVIAPERCLTSADMYPLRAHPGLRPAFLLYFVLSRRFTDMAVLESERVAMPKINRDSLGRLRVPLPPVEDQDRIVSALDSMLAHTGSAIGRLVAQIDLLVEHRQALVTAAVTGELELPGVPE